MAEQANTVTPIVDSLGRSVISELINKLNNGSIKIVKIIYKKNNGYFASMGKDFPKSYEIVMVKPGLVVYRVGHGSKRAWTPGKGVYYRVPAEAKPSEGYAIIEFYGDLVYLYLG